VCPCIATFPHLNKWNKDHKADGLEIVGVTTYYENLGFDKAAKKLSKLDTPMTADEEHTMLADFASAYQLKHQLMTLPKADYRKVGESYAVRGIPQAVLVDRKGNVRMVRVGSGKANADALEEMIGTLLKEKAE